MSSPKNQVLFRFGTSECSMGESETGDINLDLTGLIKNCLISEK